MNKLFLFELLIVVGAVLFLFFSALLLIFKKKMHSNYYLSILFFAGGYTLFYYWVLNKGFIEDIPLLIHSVITAGYLVGPSFYLYFKFLLGFSFKKTIPAWLHYIPAASSLIYFIFISISNPLQMTSEMSISQPTLIFLSENHLVHYLSVLSDVSISVYYLATLLKVLFIFKGERITLEIRILIIFILLITLSAILLTVASSSKNLDLLITSLISLILLPIYYIFFSFRYPEFSLKVLKESSALRYKKSIIKNLDVDLIINRLTYLMEEEELFSSEELNLNSFSAELKITSHQLSQILNQCYNKNFRTFINEYRIRKAKKLLLDQPDSGILEIYMAVGFNSSSSFYSAFQNETGCSPKEYRNRQCAANTVHSKIKA